MTISNPFLWLLAFLGLNGPADPPRVVEPRGNVVVLAVPDCLRGDYMPFSLMPDGELVDLLGHRIDFNRIGQGMKSRTDGSPRVLEIVVGDDRLMPDEALAEAVRKLREARDDWFDDFVYGPPNAIVFLYMEKLDPYAWWYRWLSTFPGPLSRLPKLGPDGRRVINGQSVLP